MKKKKTRKFRSLLKRPAKKKTYKKLFLYVIIVNLGYSEPLMRRLREIDSNLQIVCLGKGTANTTTLHILGLENNRKEVILSFVDESNVEHAKKEINKYFLNNDRNKGIAFTLPLTSIIGEKIYHFLTNTI